MRIGDRVYVQGTVDEIRRDTVIIKNRGGYFGTIPDEIIESEERAAIKAVIDADYKDCGVLVERRCRKFEEALRSLPAAQPTQITRVNSSESLDCISRQEAIDDLQGKDPSQIWDTADIEVWINSLPSAQPEPKWIPVTERLPDHDQICIVTDETGCGTYEYGFHNETYDEENGWTYLGHKIIAWMPLPEPYKEEQDR